MLERIQQCFGLAAHISIVPKDPSVFSALLLPNLDINLAHTPSSDMPYTRYYYPGAEDPAHAAVVMVGEHAGTLCVAKT